MAKFKQTEIGEIPEDWEVIKLGDEQNFELIMGQSPPSSTYNKNCNGLPFLQGNSEFGAISPKATIYCSAPAKEADKGDVLISVRAPVGEVNIANQKYCIGRGVGAIRAKNGVHNFYLFYYFESVKNKLDSISGGSTFKAITKGQIETFQIPLPPVPEQKSIAEILSTADQAISLVERERYRSLNGSGGGS